VSRVVLFGLDGATYTVMDDLVRRGVMPCFGAFRERSAWGTLMSVVPPLTPPAWTTMVTGRSPGHHGITNFLQFESEASKYVRVVTSREVCCETIWSIVGRQGKRAGCLNFVAHNPPPKIDGYVIPGWIPWRWVKKHSHPANLIDGLKETLSGFDVKELAVDFNEEQKAIAGAELADYEPWIDLHIRRERQWFAILEHQLQRDPAELVGIVLDGVDKLQHLLWGYLDPAMEPASPDESFLRIRERCWDYFREVDGFLEKLLKLVSDEDYIVIASDHGFCGTNELLYINNWLEAQGYLTWSDKAEVVPDDSAEIGEAHPYHLTEFDLDKTRAYAISASNNGIYIPVRGGRHEVGLEPEQYESFRAELIDRLLNHCVDPSTGEKLVTRIWTKEEAFSGPKMQLAPDLTLELRDKGFFSVLRGQGVLRRRPMTAGIHHPEGILLMNGPGVASGTSLPTMQMVDVAPTMLYAMGLAIPEDLEGRVVTEVFDPAYVSAHPAVTGAKTVRPAHLPPEETNDLADDPESEEQVMMRLKALGYID